MDRKSKQTDSWASLHSELGLETSPDVFSETLEPAAPAASEAPQTPTPSESAPVAEQHSVVVKTVQAAVDESPSQELPSAAPSSKKGTDPKKTFFDRFPKINLFGTPAKDPLDAVISGSKAAKPGESFTAKKLEKVDPPPSRASRRGNETEAVVPPTPVQPEKPVSKRQDPWSLVASQIGSVGDQTTPSAEEPRPEAVTKAVQPVETSASQRESVRKADADASVPRRGRRAPSMFDDVPEPEPQESTAVRSIFDTAERDPLEEEARRLSSIFNDEPADKPSEPKRQPERSRKPEHRQEESRQDLYQQESPRQEPRQKDSPRSEYPRSESRQQDSRQQGLQRQRGRRIETSHSEIQEKPATPAVEDRDETSTPEPKRARPWEDRSNRDRGRQDTRNGDRDRDYAKRDSRRDENFEREHVPSVPAKMTNDFDHDEPQAMWDVEDESKPVDRSSRRSRRPEQQSAQERQERPSQPQRPEFGTERSSRGSRYRNEEASVERSERPGRPERSERNAVEPSASLPSDSEQLHKNFPSWDDAISSLVEANIVRHSQRNSDRRGRR